MPYIRRDADGQIASLHREPEPGAAEFLPDADPQVQAFVGRPVTEVEDGFTRLDADFVRVVEDVIDVLIARHLINITDLPPEAYAKLCSRKGYRGRAQQRALDLFGTLVTDGPLGGLAPVVGDPVPPRSGP
jgi:hypothetical protein